MALSVLTLSGVALLALVIGVAAGWTAARRKFDQSAVRRREIGFLIRRPVDLEPSEFSTFWQERA